jgi:SAM-dependent methyltransferase
LSSSTPDPKAGGRYLIVDRDWIRRPSLAHYMRHIATVLPQAIARLVESLQLVQASRVLDFGCADQPYRKLFSDKVQYIGADLQGNALAEVVIHADGRLGLDDNTMDAVLSTQVLEHVGNPALYLSESLRVLKPGGQLLLSTHGMMILHRDPVDYWRWTSDGLRHVIEQAGFEIVHFEGLMGLGATGMQFLQDATVLKLPRFMRRGYIVIMQCLVALADRLDNDQSKALNALVFAVVARKPSAGRIS